MEISIFKWECRYWIGSHSRKPVQRISFQLEVSASSEHSSSICQCLQWRMPKQNLEMNPIITAQPESSGCSLFSSHSSLFYSSSRPRQPPALCAVPPLQCFLHGPPLWLSPSQSWTSKITCSGKLGLTTTFSHYPPLSGPSWLTSPRVITLIWLVFFSLQRWGT